MNNPVIRRDNDYKPAKTRRKTGHKRVIQSFLDTMPGVAVYSHSGTTANIIAQYCQEQKIPYIMGGRTDELGFYSTWIMRP